MYPTIVKTFLSQTTLIAADMNNNFSSILSGVSSGSETLNVADLTMTSMNVASNLVVSGSLVANSGFNVTGNTTLSGNVTVANIASCLRLGLGTYEVNTIPITKTIVPTKSYIALNADTESNLSTITTTNFRDGDILVITRDPSSTVNPTIKNGTTIILGADRILDSNYDRLVLILSGTTWLELSFRSNA